MFQSNCRKHINCDDISQFTLSPSPLCSTQVCDYQAEKEKLKIAINLFVQSPLPNFLLRRSDLHFPYFAHRGQFHLLNLTKLYPLSVSFSSTVVISSLTSTSHDSHRACSLPAPFRSISGSIKDGRSSKREIKRERGVVRRATRAFFRVTFHARETYHGKQETVDRSGREINHRERIRASWLTT